MSPAQTRSYLAHIDVPEAAPSLDYLAALQHAHLLRVPFENLSVIRGEPILLSEEQLVEKIVGRGRGGFCFELNGAFFALLEALGFAIARIGAGVKIDDGFTPDLDHMALIVILDQLYLVDVGFGDSARQPLPLHGETRTDVSGCYRVWRDGKAADYLLLQKAEGDAWITQYRFTTKPRDLADYRSRCHYLATSPDSTFTQRTICSMATPGGRISLTGEHITITDGDDQTKRPIADVAAFNAALVRYFGPAFLPAVDA